MQQSFNVTGMHCAGCASKVAAGLMGITGVRNARVSLGQGLVQVEVEHTIPVEVLRSALASAGSFELASPQGADLARNSGGLRRLLPLLLMLALVTVFAVLRNLPPATTVHWWHEVMLDYMAGFFLLFGGLKAINLRRFAVMFAQYDPLAAMFPHWGLAYPFAELALGGAYLLRVGIELANLGTTFLLGIGMLGIWRKLSDPVETTCACLGGFFSVPVTQLTLAENAAMVLMAVMMLVA